MAVAVAVSGCGFVDDGSYNSREGVGPKLQWAGLAEETALLDEYVKYICLQADLLKVVREHGLPDCNPTIEQWPVFVQAGMNDIDRRCDAFLSWVDYVRRSRENWLNQLLDTFTATSQIMSATSASPKSMQIVAAAFGFAKNSLINSTERLLTLAENSTVQSVVLGEQRKFRIDLRNYISAVNHRPAAIHTLRSYLRICMPMTIEQQINATVTIYQQAGLGGLSDKRDEPLITPQTIAPAPRATTGLAPSLPTHQPLPGAITEEERILGPVEFKKIQEMLCLDSDGRFGPKTRAALQIFQLQNTTPDTAITGQIDRPLRQSLIKEADRLGPCQRTSGLMHQNYYERALFSDSQKIGELQMRLNLGGVGDTIGTTGAFDRKTRAKIAAFRSANTLKIKELNSIIGQVRSQMTPAIDVVIPELPVAPASPGAPTTTPATPPAPSGGQR